jgi:hypothetical protein
VLIHDAVTSRRVVIESFELDQLAKLTTGTAKYVCSQSQPALWTAYVVDSAHDQEAIEYCQAPIFRSKN